MRYLLDTVALVMWWADAPRLSVEARETILSSGADFFVSAISVWEIANKNRIGKLPQFDEFAAKFAPLLAADGFTLVNLTGEHAMRAGYLPGAHRDPFDRLLAGQALVENMTVITNDPEIARFGCKVLW